MCRLFVETELLACPWVMDLLSSWGPSEVFPVLQEGHKSYFFNKDVKYEIKLGTVLGFSDVFDFTLVHEIWNLCLGYSLKSHKTFRKLERKYLGI